MREIEKEYSLKRISLNLRNKSRDNICITKSIKNKSDEKITGQNFFTISMADIINYYI